MQNRPQQICAHDNAFQDGPVQTSVQTQMSKPEFIALIAMMFATIAFSIDAMLPALPDIAQQLSPDDVNRAQLIISSFVLGMGAGTLFAGPISDALGRKTVIFGGSVIYIAASALAWRAQSLEIILAARVLQGIGAAGPRVVAMAVIRDLYQGRDMARIMSLAMMIFTIVPAFAPLLGAGIIAFAGWRGIFLAFMLFSLVVVTWMSLRLSETLPREKRKPMHLPHLAATFAEMFRHPTVRLSILVQTLCMAILFSTITMVQPIYDVVFGKSALFPVIFACVALVSGSASFLNARIVLRLGMRKIVTWSLAAHVGMAIVILVLSLTELPTQVLFVAFVIWQTGIFFGTGTTLGNLNAIAMEPMGHVAGMAASVIGAFATIGAALIAAPIGLTFNGTIWPLAVGILCLSSLGFALMIAMAKAEINLTR